jgi:hypothetical protein
MNSEVFKRFLVPHVDAAICELGGLARVRDMPHGQEIILGWVCACLHATPPRERTWRNDDDPRGGILSNELRRAQDHIRLRIETDSSTS